MGTQNSDATGCLLAESSRWDDLEGVDAEYLVRIIRQFSMEDSFESF